MLPCNTKNKFQSLLLCFTAYGAGDFLLFGLSYLLLIPTLTRHLLPSEYGISASLLAVNFILMSVMQFGLPSTVFRYFFLYEEGEARYAYFGTIWMTGMFVSCCVAVSFMLFGRPVWDGLIKNAPFDVFAKYVVWGAFFQIPFVFASVLFRAQERPRAFVLLSVAQFVCSVILILHFVVSLKQGALGQVRGYFFAYGLFALISTAILLRDVKFAPQWRHIFESVQFAFPILLTYLIGFFVSRANILILQYYDVGSAVGMFALGGQLSALIYALSAAFEKAWQPYLYSLTPEKARISLSQYAHISVSFYMLLAVVLGLFSNEVLRVFASKSYSGAWVIVAITSVGAAMTAISSVPAGAIYYAKHSKVVAWITAVTAILNVSIMFLVIPIWGMRGAACLTSVVSFLTLLFTFKGMQRYFPITLDYRLVLLPIIYGIVVLAVGCWMVYKYAADSLGYSLLIKSCAVVVYALALSKANVFSSLMNSGLREHFKTATRRIFLNSQEA